MKDRVSSPPLFFEIDGQATSAWSRIEGMNNYCDNCKQIRSFILRRTNEGTIWECEVCHFMITDMSKYKHNYYGLPVREPERGQPQ